MNHRHLLVVASALFLSILTLASGGAVFADTETQTKAQKTQNVPINKLRTFAEVFGRIKKDYVESVDDAQLLEYAIRGMLSNLDPHSSYLDATEYKDLQEGTSGKFGGLGIEVGLEDGFVKVISPIDDTPAQRAGVQAGDLIVRLDEKPVKGMDLSEAVKLMRGKPGTKIKLTIIRKKVEKPLTMTITRDIIKVASVKSRILEPGFGYVRISNFQSGTAGDMNKAVEKLQSEGQLKGMILDLRNNPGGILNSAVDVSDAYLRNGKIVYTEGKASGSKLSFIAKPDDILEGAPMVVLVNQGSASASEIVAGALQDHKRALIMGSRTFGKGSVQSIIPVTSDIAVKLTTARYFTPSGRSIQAEGIKPDIELPQLEVKSLIAARDATVKEADLSRHLSNGNGNGIVKGKGKKKVNEKGKKEEMSKKDEADKAEPKKKSLAVTDYQLFEALNMLKGLSLLQGAGPKG